jgi:hypothetical protein
LLAKIRAGLKAGKESGELDKDPAQEVRNHLRTVVATTTVENDDPMEGAVDTADATVKAFNLMRNVYQDLRNKVDAMPDVEDRKRQTEAVSWLN